MRSAASGSAAHAPALLCRGRLLELAPVGDALGSPAQVGEAFGRPIRSRTTSSAQRSLADEYEGVGGEWAGASGAIVLGEVGRRWCPGSKARDAGCRVRSLHRIQGVGALGGREIALEERVVIDGALGLVREDGGGNAWGAMHRSTARPRGHTPPRRRAGVSAPRR